MTTGELLYVTRDWMLADSTLATPAVVGQPVPQGPTGSGYENEYKLYQDGFRNTDNEIVGDGTDLGFGLRNPDKDANHTTNGPATDVPNLKPAMTVLYVAANDMLHAFRAGPNCASPNPYELPPGTTNPPFSGFRYSACAETGGEELWGFVPFDQLGKLRQRLSVQTRSNHTYMLAASLRFGDVFVPNPGTAVDRDNATTSLTIGTQTELLKGVWRRVLIFGRGLAGKSLTVLDITTPGDYKTLANNTVPPVVYWNRGNIDTNDGTAGGTANGTAGDKTAYARMGETWSVPTMAFVDRAATGSGPGGLVNSTARKPVGHRLRSLRRLGIRRHERLPEPRPARARPSSPSMRSPATSSPRPTSLRPPEPRSVDIRTPWWPTRPRSTPTSIPGTLRPRPRRARIRPPTRSAGSTSVTCTAASGSS